MDLHSERFQVLSLCSGAGGIELGLRLAVPHARTICYIEREAYACAVLVSRMEDQTLDSAPVWTDVRTFDGKPWRGAVDCLTGGYPCQPFSVAGRQRGADDPRHLWPDIARIIREVQPRWCFFENVANHLNLGYREVRRDLEEMGFRVAEGLFTAAEVGAPHKRQRLFILAHSQRAWRGTLSAGSDSAGEGADGDRKAHCGLGEPGRILAHSRRQLRGPIRPAPQPAQPVSNVHHQRSSASHVAHTAQQSEREPEYSACTQSWKRARQDTGRRGINLADTHSARLEKWSLRGSECADEWPAGKSGRPLFPAGPADAAGWERILTVAPDLQPALSEEEAESLFRRGIDGISEGVDRNWSKDRADRLRLLGNAVMPQCAALAFLTLLDQLKG